MTDDPVQAFVQAALAAERMEQLRSYTERGRMLAAVSSDELASRWKAEFKKFAADPSLSGAKQAADDIEAELGLRGLTAPMDDADVAPFLEMLTKAVIQQRGTMTEEEMNDAGRRFIEEANERLGMGRPKS